MGCGLFYFMTTQTEKRLAKGKALGGAPSKFDSIDKDQFKTLVLQGMTDLQICDFFKIDDSTLYRWKAKHIKFCESLKDWKAEADSVVEKSLYHRAKGYSHKSVKMFMHEGEVIKEEYVEHYPPDPTSMIFWLKNRKASNWQDKPLVTIDNSKHTHLTNITFMDKEDNNIIDYLTQRLNGNTNNAISQKPS